MTLKVHHLRPAPGAKTTTSTKSGTARQGGRSAAKRGSGRRGAS